YSGSLTSDDGAQSYPADRPLRGTPMPNPSPDRPAFWPILTPQQRKVFARLEKLLAESSHRLDWHHAVGQQVLEWRKTLADWRPVPFRKVAKALWVSRERLNRDAKFARAYTADEVEKLQAQEYSWGEIEAVLYIGNKKERARLL